MGTSGVSQPLISWALACLLYTLITYTALEAMSGEALHVSSLLNSSLSEVSQNTYVFRSG